MVRGVPLLLAQGSPQVTPHPTCCYCPWVPLASERRQPGQQQGSLPAAKALLVAGQRLLLTVALALSN